MQKFYLLCFLVLGSFAVKAQTFTGNGAVIPADGTPAYSTIVPGYLTASTLDTNFGVVSVCVNIYHTNDADLEVALIAPDGTMVMLSYANGGDGNNFIGTCFDDKVETPIANGSAPFEGSFRPNGTLGNVNNGHAGYGTWQLYVHDLNPWSDNGNFQSWSITFGPHAPAPFTFTSSNLPIVIIDTYGQPIPDDPKIPAWLKIINNGPGVRNYMTDTAEFEGHSGIEVRGSSSQSFPKKSYGLETWDGLGNSIDTSLLGMPSESDWILNANYTDKSLMRNTMAYQVWQNMGYYATRYQFCEVMLNGQYQGIYIFSEKIKRDKNRVDIAKLDPDENTGDNLTGGYIIKIDKQTGSGGAGWTSSYPPSANPYGQTIFFQYDYPKAEDISIQQRNYIKNYVYDFETTLKGSNFADTVNGYRKYSVENTFFDYFIENEITKNVDGYRLSTFLQKEIDSRGGKLRMGPVWDYDIAWHNANYCGGDVTSGWAYQFPCPDDTWQVPFWWSRLLQDPLYREHLKCRWLYLRQNVLSNNWFDNYIDSIAGQLDEAQQRNFVKWPILGIYVWPNPWPYATTYAGEVGGLKTWIHNRLAWLDTNMPGTCETTFAVNNIAAQNEFSIYPNPVSDMMNVVYKTVSRSTIKITIVNQQGSVLKTTLSESKPAGEWYERFDMSSYSPGVYLIRLTIDGQSYSKKIIKI
jgi:subtilisin-like proprotein convertase family protein